MTTQAELTSPAGDVTGAPEVSVVIGTYDAARRAQLDEAVRSVLAQASMSVEILVVVDNNPALADALADEWGAVRVVDHRGPRGVSGMRNAGIDASRGALVAFLDDDAVAGAGWVSRMTSAFDDPSVLGVGGAIRTRWTGTAPAWFPEAFDWAVGGTSAGMPAKTAPVRNLRGGNMCLRRSAFEAAGAFSPEWGHNGSVADYCDETEMCIRATRSLPGSVLLFDPAMEVDHHVTSERATLRFFVDRCYREGRSKAALAASAGGSLAVERRYATRVVPRAIGSALADTVLRGDPWGICRAGAVALGLASAGAGYVARRVRPGTRRAL